MAWAQKAEKVTKDRMAEFTALAQSPTRFKRIDRRLWDVDI